MARDCPPAQCSHDVPMSGAPAAGGLLRRLLALRIRLAMIACAGVFAWAVAQFHQPATGFTSLIAIGEVLELRKVSALRQVPHYVYEDSAGYDGAYYVQLALHPTLDSPELYWAIDNLSYRARRILFCWVAWLLGLGQPAWIVQAHALLNVICWFALAWVLLRWFPPTSWDRFLRWFGILFSHGVCMSVRNSLVDAPSLLLVALAVRWLEEGRRGTAGAVLGLAGLGKETNLLAVAGFADPLRRDRGIPAWRSARAWLRYGLASVLVTLPLLAWMAYIRWKTGPAEDPGLGNFTVPLAGLAEKWAHAVGGLVLGRHDPLAYWATAAATLALTVQFLYLVSRWRPGDLWWRIGAVFAGMMVFLSTPVWEGFPGAATRVLLPMTLAFNVLVPRGRKWLPVLLMGNLSVIASVREFNPPREFFHLGGSRAALVHVRAEPAGGWYGVEHDRGVTWSWSSGEALLRIRNESARTIPARIRGRAGSAHDERRLRIVVSDTERWVAPIARRPVPFEVPVALRPGETVVRFETDRPPTFAGEDVRPLAFRVLDLQVILQAPAEP
jgi:hypothetical protein